MAFVPQAPVSEELNIVLIGSFSPAIFHPEWFVRNALFGEDVLPTSKVEAVTPDFTQFELKSLRLTCTTDRFTLSTTSEAYSEVLLDSITGILEILSDLSISAVGINNVGIFHVRSEAYWHKIGHTLAPKALVWDELCEQPGMQSLSIRSPITDLEFPIYQNIAVSPLGYDHPHHPALNIATNFHFDLPTSKDIESPLTGVEYVEWFIGTIWIKATQHAKEVAGKIVEKIPQ